MMGTPLGRCYSKISALIMAAVLPAVALAQSPCSVTWGSNTQISFDPHFSVTPRVIACGDTVHIFWSQGGLNYSRSCNGGGTFTSQFQLVPGEVLRSDGANIGASGNLVCVLYEENADPPAYSYETLLRSTDAGNTWAKTSLSFDDNYMRRAICVSDSSVYLYFLRYTGITWTGVLLRSQDSGEHWDTTWNAPVAGWHSSLFATPEALLLVLDSGGPYEVLCYRSTDRGATFSLPETLSTNDNTDSSQPSMCGNRAGDVFVCWEDGLGRVMMRHSSDGGLIWGTQVYLSSSTRGDFPVVACRDSTVVVGWNSSLGRPIIRMSFDLGVTWCDTFSVNSTGGDVAVATDNHLVHAAWGQGDDGIHYRRGDFGHQSPAKDVAVNISSRWNIVTLPVGVTDNARSAVFPTSISDAYLYTGGGYEPRSSLFTGLGYWLKFPDSETVTLHGNVRTNETVSVSAGWNLVGSGISSPIPVSSIVTSPEGIIQSKFFGYSNGYQSADTLKPGLGYWVKLSSDGTIRIDQCQCIIGVITMTNDRSPP